MSLHLGQTNKRIISISSGYFFESFFCQVSDHGNNTNQSYNETEGDVDLLYLYAFVGTHTSHTCPMLDGSYKCMQNSSKCLLQVHCQEEELDDFLVCIEGAVVEDCSKLKRKGSKKKQKHFYIHNL